MRLGGGRVVLAENFNLIHKIFPEAQQELLRNHVVIGEKTEVPLKG